MSSDNQSSEKVHPEEWSLEWKNPLLEGHGDKNELMAIAAAKGAGLALVAAGLIAVSGGRYSKTYQTLSPTMKRVLLGTGMAASGVIFADSTRVHFEDRQLLRHLDDEAKEVARADLRAERGVLAELNYQLRENRNVIVGFAWLTCMAGSLGYTFSKKGLTTTQRIVTARMYAQGFTLLTMMSVAALELTEAPETKKVEMTDQWRAILAKDRQGEFIVRDPATASAKASLSNTVATA